MAREQEKGKEIGGYIELWQNAGSMLHEGALALNCGKNALAYLLEACDIKRILLPRFLCHSMRDACLQYGTDVRYYSIGRDFLPRGGYSLVGMNGCCLSTITGKSIMPSLKGLQGGTTE